MNSPVTSVSEYLESIEVSILNRNLHEGFHVPYFKIGNTPGGNQDWFVDWWMHIGGCGALAACDLCLCLAKNYGFQDLIPFSTEHLTQSMYLDLGMKMKPYIRPRMGGVSKLSFFTKGLEKYMKDRGYQVKFDLCPGENDVEEAMDFIKNHLKENMPVACLLLRHRNVKFKDIIWHWFMITGYEIREDDMILTYHTYGHIHKISLKEMWNTGFRKKGGFVAISPKNLEKI